MSSPFLLRLRANSAGIQDLAGNTLSITGVDYSSAGRFSGGRALYFDGQNTTKLDYFSNAGISEGQDFTVSFWYKIAEDAWNDYAGVICKLASDPSLGIEFSVWYNNRTLRPDNSAEVFMNGSRIISVSTTTLPKSDMFSSTIWKHCALTRRNNIVRLFINGIKYDEVVDNSSVFNDLSSTPVTLMGYPQSDSVINPIQGYLDDICIIAGKALWTENFTPPTTYLSLNELIYLSGQEAWGINGSGNFAKLSNNYSAMTDAEKIAMFDATNGDIPTIAQLKTLTMPIKAVSYNADNTEPTCTVTAVPAPQTVTPKGRISLKNYAKLKGVSITGATSGNGSVKVAATKDNSTYQVYDTTNLAWIDINIADIGTDGMSLSDVAALTTAEWAAYDCMDSGIGFAYYLEMSSTRDTAYTDELTLNVELLGELKSLVKGTDYDYSYVSNDVLQVKLFKNGDFRINYNPGES